LDVLDRLAAITGKPVRIDRQPPSPGDVRHTGADTARAREQLGYAPKVGIDEGLRRENEWMIRYLAGDGE
ncbi:MAG: UDP-glucose 4-epimerase, partial [Candidatus Eisenbacteria bacterium]|nr:UDP-glucose 4-epimerase [Candidatus Eisenbacteria bacterium]